MSKILNDARNLWTICFPEDSEAFLDYYFSRVASEEDTYILYGEKNEALAHIGILRYYYGGDESFKLAYISGACTHPNYRKQGLMNRLMLEVIETERKKGTNALILLPADEKLRIYYNKNFGFENTAELNTLSLDEYFAYLKEQKGADSSQLKAKDVYELLQIYYKQKMLQHISFNLKQAKDIVDEYTSTEGAYCLSAYAGDLCVGLLLARLVDCVCYVDSIIGNHDTKIELLSRLKQKAVLSTQFRVNHIFDIKLIGKDGGIPWGMYLSICPKDDNEKYKCLGISLVHN